MVEEKLGEARMAKLNTAFKALFEKPEVSAQELTTTVRQLLPDMELEPAQKERAERAMKFLTKEVTPPAWESARQRGLFVVFEGLDRSGKSTQSKELLATLEKQGTPTKWTCFPMRQTALGCLIDLYLRRKLEMPDSVVHMLFSA